MCKSGSSMRKEQGRALKVELILSTKQLPKLNKKHPTDGRVNWLRLSPLIEMINQVLNFSNCDRVSRKISHETIQS